MVIGREASACPGEAQTRAAAKTTKDADFMAFLHTVAALVDSPKIAAALLRRAALS
jgi:hypothetical protein